MLNWKEKHLKRNSDCSGFVGWCMEWGFNVWQSLIYVACLAVTMWALKTSIPRFSFQYLGLKINSITHLGILAKLSFFLSFF